MKTRVKPGPLPVIDLAGWLCVIEFDAAADKLKLKKVERLVAAHGPACVARAMKKHGLTTAWVLDATGEKRLVAPDGRTL